MLRVLYLANYAPTDAAIPEEDALSGQRVVYHREVFDILSGLGLTVEAHRDLGPLINRSSTFDYVFSLLNRAPYRGSEVLVSALCEYFHLPYLGAHPHTRAVAEDKHLGKLIAAQVGFTVPRSTTYRRSSEELAPPEFPGPYIAKPRCGAASKHMTESCIQDAWEDLVPEVKRLLETGDDVLVEEFVEGINVSLPLIGGVPPIVLPAYKLWSPKKGQLVTHDQKRRIEKNLKRTLFDDHIVYQQLRKCTLALYREVQPVDYLRVDVRLTNSGTPVFLEFNVCCNIGSTSGFTFCAQQAGLSHRDLIIRILRYSLERQKIQWQPF